MEIQFLAELVFSLGALWEEKHTRIFPFQTLSQETLGLGALTAATLPETNIPCPSILTASMLNRPATPAPVALSFAHPEMHGTYTRVDTIKASDFRL